MNCAIGAARTERKLYQNLRRLALHGENDYVRVAATKLWIEYGFGKPPEDRNDEPRLQHATLHHSGKDGGGGQVNRRATLHRRV